MPIDMVPESIHTVSILSWQNIQLHEIHTTFHSRDFPVGPISMKMGSNNQSVM